MTTTGDLRIDDWVVHRPNVVRSVAARVPGIDAEDATSRALEEMVRIVSTGGTIDDPAPYWRRAAVNEAISMTREASHAHPVEDDTLDGLTPPVVGTELDAERQADASMLRTALSDLADEGRKILFDRHVHDMAVTDIAGDLGVRPHAVTMRLRRAEERLAGAFAAAHAHGVNEPECRITRASMHDYLKGRLLPRRQRRLEVHMDGCAECTRAFIDVREVSWMLRDLGQHLIAAGLITATGTSAEGPPPKRPRSFGKKEAAMSGGVVAALAIAGGTAAYIANQPDQPPTQAIDAGAIDAGAIEGMASEGGAGGGAGGSGGAGGGGAGDGSGAEPTTEEQPPSIPPADPAPRPATTPKEDAATAPEPVTAPDEDGPAVVDPAPAPEQDPEPPASDPDPGSDPGRTPDGGTDEPAPEDPVDPPTEPEPEPPVEQPDPPDAPDAPAPGLGTALEDLLAGLGLSDLPGIDLATMTLDEVWELLFGGTTNAAEQAANDAESATGG